MAAPSERSAMHTRLRMWHLLGAGYYTKKTLRNNSNRPSNDVQEARSRKLAQRELIKSKMRE